MYSIHDIIYYILSFFVPAVKKDLHIQSIIEKQINEDVSNDSSITREIK